MSQRLRILDGLYARVEEKHEAAVGERRQRLSELLARIDQRRQEQERLEWLGD